MCVCVCTRTVSFLLFSLLLLLFESAFYSVAMLSAYLILIFFWCPFCGWCILCLIYVNCKTVWLYFCLCLFNECVSTRMHMHTCLCTCLYVSMCMSLYVYISADHTSMHVGLYSCTALWMFDSRTY